MSHDTSAHDDALGHPLGPAVIRTRVTWWGRAVATAVFAGSAAVVLIASRLPPDPAGFGTHEQLGLSPCLALTLTGYPCPTCGMTTAAAYTVRGRLLSAWNAQPAGFLLAIAMLIAPVVSLSVLVTGRGFALNWYRIRPQWWAAGFVAFILLAWVYKIATGLLNGNLPFVG